MKDKIIIITGATSGIGTETALALSAKETQIGIVARNEEKALATADLIFRTTGNEKIKTFLSDFTSLKSVKAAGEDILRTYDRIDILVNNAGVILKDKREVSHDGLEATLAVNHFSPFLLTAMLFERLKESSDARIINLSSMAYKVARPDFDDLQLNKKYSPMLAYCNSKLYNIMFTRELARRLQNFPSVTVNALHPGVVASGFATTSGGKVGLLFKLIRPFLISPKKGAANSIFLATNAEVKKINGQFFKKNHPFTVKHPFLTVENERKLWEVSEHLTGKCFLSDK